MVIFCAGISIKATSAHSKLLLFDNNMASERELREWQLEDELDAWYLQECQAIPNLLNDNYFNSVRNLRNNYRAKLAEIQRRVAVEFSGNKR